jgi:glycosyltransferase involved in cell wall biosynthesis
VLPSGSAISDRANAGATAALCREWPLVLHARVATGRGGGPDKTILNSPRFYEQHGYRALCAYLHPPGDRGANDLEERAAALGAPFISIADRGPVDIRAVRELTRICREQRVAIWHGHDPKTDVLGLLVSRFWPMRMVSTVHGWITNTRREHWYKQFDKWSLRHYEQVVCVSERLLGECRNAGISANKSRLIHNGIDTQTCRRKLARKVAKRKLGIPADTLLIGSVGRLSDEKGYDLLIQAVLQLIARGQDHRLHIAGEGPAREKLERLIASTGSEERIKLLGHVADPSELFQALDVFALSSLTEGLPNCLLEAMALEAPVVATRVGGVPALVIDGETGISVEPGDVTVLAAGIARMCKEESLRERCSVSARNLIEKTFSLARRMEQMCNVYDELLASQPPR